MSSDHNRMCTPPPGWPSLLMLNIHIPAGMFTLQCLWYEQRGNAPEAVKLNTYLFNTTALCLYIGH